jgi:hypothetical protein
LLFCDLVDSTVLASQLDTVAIKLKAIEARLMAWHRQDQTSQLLATIPGIGPIGGVSFALKVPDPKAFRSGRHFAAWIGITPRENSTAGRQQLGRISKQGDEDLRRLLVIGATAVIRGRDEGGREFEMLAMIAGLGLAYLYYILVPSLPALTAKVFKPIYLFLLNKWYFDELYDFIFVRPTFWLGRLLWKQGDGAIIDRLGPDGIASRVLWTTGRIVKLQTGYVYHYAFAMLIGVALFVTWFMFYGGAVR